MAVPIGFILFIIWQVVKAKKKRRLTEEKHKFLRTDWSTYLPKDDEDRTPPKTSGAPVAPDPHFKDQILDKLIAERKLDGARAYMHKMILVSRDMKEKTREASYRAYEKKIEDAESTYSDRSRKAEKKNVDDDVHMEFMDD
jgi:hypothetical protein